MRGRIVPYSIVSFIKPLKLNSALYLPSHDTLIPGQHQMPFLENSGNWVNRKRPELFFSDREVVLWHLLWLIHWFLFSKSLACLTLAHESVPIIVQSTKGVNIHRCSRWTQANVFIHTFLFSGVQTLRSLDQWLGMVIGGMGYWKLGHT